MRSVVGLLWALGGALAGLIIGVIGANIFASVTDMSSREGARGYFAIFIGLICAVIGLVVGLVLYGKSAPSGQGAANFGSGALGFVGLIAAIAVGTWLFLQSREVPLMYGGTQASLEMEFRVKTADLPRNASARWLNVEVQTAKTRPEGTVSWSGRRVEGEFTIIPVSQGALYRSSSRMIVVRVGEQQTEMFSPPMKRTPDPKADWSEWYPPTAVEPSYGVTPPAPLQSVLELRYKLRLYGE
ncbi:MAG: hypothetical protein ABI120_19630 [Gemmatimonadaceae bacterium]